MPLPTTNLALRATDAPVALEKWYLDVLLDDGGVLLVYLISLRLLGAAFARVTVELFGADGSARRRGFAVRRGDIHGGQDMLAFGAARIDGERLTVRARGVECALRYRSRAAAVDAPAVVEHAGRSVRWSIEVPDADVNGEVELDGARVPIVGRGYRDRVFVDTPVRPFPVRALTWGRAVAGPHAATWMHATLHADLGGGARGACVVDGVLAAHDSDEPPADVRLGPARAFVDADVLDLPALRLGALKRALSRLTDAPHEVKLAAPVQILGVDGRAVFERVVWPAPRRGGRR